MLGLADAVRAVDGLGLDGRVPPGVEQEDVVGGGQVQAEAAGLEADQEDRAVGVVLEPLDPAGAVAGAAVEVLVGDASPASSRSRTIARKLVNWEKTRTLCPSSTTSAICGRSMSSLALGSPAQLGVDQAGVAGGLAEPQERLEDLDLRPVQLGGVLAQERVAVVLPQLVVAAAAASASMSQ